MTVFLINSYDINDPETFKEYPLEVAKILPKYGGKVLASDTHGQAIEGNIRTMNAIIEFPTEQAMKNCYNDPQYQQIKKIRYKSTSNCTMILVNKRE